MNPVVIISAAVVALLLILVLRDVFHKETGSLDGEYSFSFAQSGGTSVTSNELLMFGVDASSLAIEIDGDIATMCLYGDTIDCELEVDGDKLTFTRGEKTIEGRADLEEETVTLEMDNVDLILEKI